MAAVEIYKYPYPIANYNYMNTETYLLATFFSASNHFDIVDSYSHKLGLRWKGDPIADGKWSGGGDLDEMQDWFIIECKTQHPALAAMGYTGLPKWQAKLQFSGGIVYGPYYPFQDVSDPTGVKYPKNHNVSSIECTRFAPYGGWDFADVTPDFNPASPPPSGHVSTQNHKSRYGTGTGTKQTVVILADGVFIRLEFMNNISNKWEITTVGNIVGDVIPINKDFMPNPRCLYGNGTGTGNIVHLLPPGSGIGFLADDANTNGTSDYATTDGVIGGIAFWDENENLIESGYRTVNNYGMQWGYSSEYSLVQDVEFLPFIPMPWKTQNHPYFIYPYVRKAFMPFMGPVLDKQWYCTGKGYGPAFVWDGSTDDPF